MSYFACRYIHEIHLLHLHFYKQLSKQQAKMARRQSQHIVSLLAKKRLALKIRISPNKLINEHLMFCDIGASLLIQLKKYFRSGV